MEFQWLNLKEAAEFVGVSRQTIDRWKNQGRLPKPIRKGRVLYYDPAELEPLKRGKKQ